MNSVLWGGYGGQSKERRQPILQTLSCLVPLHLLKAFYTQRLWGSLLMSSQSEQSKPSLCVLKAESPSPNFPMSLFTSCSCWFLDIFSHPLYNYLVSALLFHVLTFVPHRPHYAFFFFLLLKHPTLTKLHFLPYFFCFPYLFFSFLFILSIKFFYFQNIFNKILRSLCLLKNTKNYFPQITLQGSLSMGSDIEGSI